MNNIDLMYEELLEMPEIWDILEEKYKEHKAEQKRKQKEKVLYYLKQKLCGLILILCGVAAPIVLDGDLTGSILFIPLGMYLGFTKEKVMDFQ